MKITKIYFTLFKMDLSYESMRILKHMTYLNITVSKWMKKRELSRQSYANLMIYYSMSAVHKL